MQNLPAALPILLILIIVVAAAVAWFIFARVAREQDITLGQAIQNTVRRDLDTARLTPGRVNFAYRSLMRGTGVVGPAGKVIPVAAIEVRVPDEDFMFIRHLGVNEYAAQLSNYRRDYAVKQGWSKDGEPAAAVTLVADPKLKRLRPSSINYFRDRAGSSQVYLDNEGVTKTMGHTKTTERTQTTELTKTYENRVVGTLAYDDRGWTLDESRVYRLGRTVDNDIQIEHPEVSAHHAGISFDGESWVLTPAGAKNPTRVDGSRVEGPTRLSAGAVITIGSSQPIVFALENASEARTEEL